jgi:frataxin-like iron-binding protein CyaY
LFNLFKKKISNPKLEIKEPEQKVIETYIPKEQYVLNIKLKNNEILIFNNESPEMPISFRKILGWYSYRNSKMYTFVYNKGVLVIDRDTINFIKCYKTLI